MSTAAVMSKHLSAKQIRAIERIGSWMIPGDGELPSFASSGCVSQVDRILDYMPEKDLADLQMLLKILAVFPALFLNGLLRFFELSANSRLGDWMPGPIGPTLRLIRLGLRGLVMTLYYSHPAVLGVIGYRVFVYTSDLQK